MGWFCSSMTMNAMKMSPAVLFTLNVKRKKLLVHLLIIQCEFEFVYSLNSNFTYEKNHFSPLCGFCGFFEYFFLCKSSILSLLNYSLHFFLSST